MRRKKWVYCLLLWGMLGAFRDDGAVANGEDASEAIAENVSKCWSRLLKSEGPAEYRAVVVAEGSDDNYYRRYVSHMKRRGDSVVYLSHEKLTHPNGERADEKHTCFGRNEDYAFQLTKTHEDAPWILRRLALRSTDPDRAYINRYLHIFLSSIDLRSLLVEDQLLPRIVKSPASSGLKYSQVEHGGQALVALELDYHPTNNEKTVLGLPARSMHARVLLDPSRSFVACEATTTRNGGKSERHEAIKCDAEHPLIVRSRVAEWNKGGKHYTATHNAEIVSYDRHFAPEDFRLSAFGLPEPEGFEQGRVGYIPWILGMAAVTLILGGLWRMSRKKSNPARG